MHAVSDHMDWPISNHVELWARLRMLAYPVRAPISMPPMLPPLQLYHLMLLYSTSLCEQILALRLQ
jgi:hypothetical protein